MDYRWYLVEDTARPLQYAHPPLPHQINFILAKLTLHWVNHKKGGECCTAPGSSGSGKAG
jgi:hypothetical protein